MIRLDLLEGVDWNNPDVKKLFEFFGGEFKKLHSRYDKAMRENAELKAQVEELTKLNGQIKSAKNM